MKIVTGILEKRNEELDLIFICSCGEKSVHSPSMETIILGGWDIKIAQGFLMTTRISHCPCMEDTLIIIPLTKEEINCLYNGDNQWEMPEDWHIKRALFFNDYI